MDISSDIGAATLVLRGRLDGRSTSEVRQAIHALLDAHPGDVVLDLAGVETVDLTVLKAIAFATRRARLDGRRLLLRDCPTGVRRMLHLTRLIRAVELESEVVPA